MPAFVLGYRASSGFVCLVHIRVWVPGYIVFPLGCVFRPRDLWVGRQRPSLDDQVEVSFLAHRLGPVLSGKAVDDDVETEPFKLTPDDLGKWFMPVEHIHVEQALPPVGYHAGLGEEFPRAG